METSQRYIVREITGYSGIGTDRQTTDVMVLDRWDCCRVVTNLHPGNSLASNRLDQRRLTAKALARSLEYDHRRWLAGTL
jgi:hypothetical protein